MNKQQLFQTKHNAHSSLQSLFSTFPKPPVSLHLSEEVTLPDLVVFSHLRWEFVFQRPQHIMTRLAKNRKILFIEEPIPFHLDNEVGNMKISSPSPNITVVQPKLRSLSQVLLLAEIVKDVLKKQEIKRYASWFYSASFIDVLPLLESQFVVYDCMDELGAFKGASQELIENENKLLKLADVIFTGGKSLYESKSKRAFNVYCYPSSVDVNHFNIGARENGELPSEIKHVKGPVVGFYGVIDERMDLELLKTVASSLPSVTFLIIGPIAKIGRSDLPTNKNIIYPGQKTYKELPYYLAGIDVAIMPFALNEATRFISPTKTLEFLAASKPVVSTPITDVVRDYINVVEIAYTPQEFVTKIKEVLHESTVVRTIRIRNGLELVKKTSWDKTVQAMEENMNDVLKGKYKQDHDQMYSVPALPTVPWNIAYDQS